MDILVLLVPLALFMGLIGLVAFLWNLRSGQYEDLDGAASRILFDDPPHPPSRPPPPSHKEPTP